MTGSGIVAKRAASVNVDEGSLGSVLTQIGQLGGSIAKQDFQLQEKQLDAAHEADIAILQRKRSVAIATKMGEMTELERLVDTELDSQRNFADPINWDEQSSKIIKERWTKFADNLGDDPEILNRFHPAIDRVREAALYREEDYGRKQRSMLEMTGIEAMDQARIGQLQRSNNPESDFLSYVKEMTTFASGLDMPRAAMINMVENKSRNGAMVIVKRLTEQGKFDQAEKLAAAPEFDWLLGGKPRELLMNEISNERRAAAVLIERAASEEREAARKINADISYRIDKGEHVPAAEMNAALANSKKAGLDPLEMTKLTDVSLENNVARSFGIDSDPDGTKAALQASHLRQKQAAGTATPDEQRAIAYLEKVAEARSKATGSAMKDLAAKGPQGKMEVLGKISGFDDIDQRFNAGEAAGKNLGYVSLLPRQTQEAVLKGMEDVATPGQKILDMKKADGAFAGRIGVAGIGLSGESQRSYMQLANGYYAYYAKQQGIAADQFNPELYDAAVRVAFGGERRGGTWYGGAGMFGKTPVLLPQHMSDKMFEQLVHRFPYADAYVSNGVKASKADILANFAPVWVGNQNGADEYHYRQKSSGKWLKLKDGVTNYPLLIPVGAK
jgi:hypothetical protein